MDKVSVIVPVYGVEQYISQCIESLIAQTYKNIEIILVDDGSKDRSGSICDEYAVNDRRITVLHKQNGGLTSARNHGLQYATGEWIMHVDGDDWIEPDAIEILLKKANETNADIVFADFWFDYPKRHITSNFYDWKRQGGDGLKEYISTSWTCLSGSMQKKSLYDENKLNSPEGIDYCEDFHLIVRLCYFAKIIVKVEQPLYHYRQHNSSMIHNNCKKNGIDERRVYADIIDFFKQQGVYNDFKECMAWRSLNASEDLALSTNTFAEFCNFNPDKKDFILRCPKIGIKLKIIMWCITHGLQSVATIIISTRKLLGR
jgi:hypothetical protein BACCOPRO_03223